MRIHEEDEEAIALERVHGRLQDLRMDVPQVVRRPLAREVDVLLALDIVQEGALRGRDHDVRELRVVGPEVLRVEFRVALPVPVRGALRPDRGPRPLLRHPRGERPPRHRALWAEVYEDPRRPGPTPRGPIARGSGNRPGSASTSSSRSRTRPGRSSRARGYARSVSP